MTETDWLTCSDSTPMLEFLLDNTSHRKLCLYGSACCHRFWQHITHEHSRNAVEVLEKYADGLATERQLTAVFNAHERTFGKHSHDGIYYGVEAAIQIAYGSNPYYVLLSSSPDLISNERLSQSSLLREIFGNPFRPATIDPRWLSSTVIDLAHSIYDERAFERMPILADALMDAGCDSDEIINHCRSEGLHVRGCWVVDLLLSQK
jgi:hypothetical protein